MPSPAGDRAGRCAAAFRLAQAVVPFARARRSGRPGAVPRSRPRHRRQHRLPVRASGRVLHHRELDPARPRHRQLLGLSLPGGRASAGPGAVLRRCRRDRPQLAERADLSFAIGRRGHLLAAKLVPQLQARLPAGPAAAPVPAGRNSARMPGSSCSTASRSRPMRPAAFGRKAAPASVLFPGSRNIGADQVFNHGVPIAKPGSRRYGRDQMQPLGGELGDFR